MDPDSSGEDVVTKARKPYTITKQRERWTEKEHTRFLEALKLYGRAWQRIEEHIGTKTAVQIRSHAQKFFTKLEKEATVKGVGHALDIEIPPPRPKRKPTNPYPRKLSIYPGLQLDLEDGKVSDPTFTSSPKKMTLTIEKEPEKLCGDAKLHYSSKCRVKDCCLEALDLHDVAPCTFPTLAVRTTSVFQAPEKCCSFRRYVPVVNESSYQDESAASMVTAEPMEIHEEKAEKNLFHSNVESLVSVNVDGFQQTGNCCENEQGSQNHPPHIPVHSLDGMSWMQQQYMFNQNGVGDQNVFHQPFLNCHPLCGPMQNPDEYQSFLYFSSLISSALTQSGAAYAAATFASTMWPYFNMEVPSVEPSAGASQTRPVNQSNLAAIAAATVAAATAWWAANGLLPLCTRFHTGFTCSPASAPAAQMENINEDRRETGLDHPVLELDPEFSEARNSAASKSPTSLVSDTEASDSEKLNGGGLTAKLELHDLNKSKNRQVDRSSCGSNTPSSSEVEADATEKLINTNEVPEAVLPTIDLLGRRCRYNNTIKEVSEEGRLAFQALFSREVLPQSFSPKAKKPSTTQDGNGEEKKDRHDVDHMRVMENNISCSIIGGGNNKLKGRRTGFKPYKRCSMEGKEMRLSSKGEEEEKGPKKLRLDFEGEAFL